MHATARINLENIIPKWKHLFTRDHLLYSLTYIKYPEQANTIGIERSVVACRCCLSPSRVCLLPRAEETEGTGEWLLVGMAFLWGVMKMFQHWFGGGCSFVNITRTPELYTLNGELLGMWTIPQQSYFSKGKAIPSYPGHLLVPRTPLGTGKCPRHVSCVLVTSSTEPCYD